MIVYCDAETMTRNLGGTWIGRYGTAPCPVCQPEARRGQNALTLGDATDRRLLAHCKKTGCDFKNILAAAGLSSYSYTPDSPPAVSKRIREAHVQAEKRAAQANRCWQEAQPIADTPAEHYLRTRGISYPFFQGLRFHAACWHGPTKSLYPAMVAEVQGADFPAVHRTYLRTDGTGKAGLDGGDKLMLGATAGGAVRLSEGNGPLLIAEGVESTLSAFLLHADLTASAWACLSTSGMRGLRLPKIGRLGRLGTSRPSLIIAVDGDVAGRGAGRDLAERAVGLGWQVSIADPGDGADWNDRLIEREQSCEF